MKTVCRQLLCATILAALSLHASAAEPGLVQSDIAAADVRANTACAASSNGGLKKGVEVTLVLEGKTQQIISGVIERNAASSECESLEKAMLPKPYYIIRLEKEIEAPFDIGILVIRPRSLFRQSGRRLVASFNNKEIWYSFRQCTSQEGVHSFVSRKDAGKEKPIWHSYYHLAYDTVPNCTNRDVKMMKNF